MGQKWPVNRPEGIKCSGPRWWSLTAATFSTHIWQHFSAWSETSGIDVDDSGVESEMSQDHVDDISVDNVESTEIEDVKEPSDFGLEAQKLDRWFLRIGRNCPRPHRIHESYRWRASPTGFWMRSGTCPFRCRDFPTKLVSWKHLGQIQRTTFSRIPNFWSSRSSLDWCKGRIVWWYDLDWFGRMYVAKLCRSCTHLNPRELSAQGGLHQRQRGSQARNDPKRLDWGPKINNIECCLDHLPLLWIPTVHT